jgi:hypothetical protein
VGVDAVPAIIKVGNSNFVCEFAEFVLDPRDPLYFSMALVCTGARMAQITIWRKPSPPPKRIDMLFTT